MHKTENGTEIRIVTLPAMRMASVHGFGQSPELLAWEKLEAWAAPQGYLDDREAHPIFGFNNPNPSPGSPNYGYEFWMKVGPEEEPAGDVRIVDVDGGLYAVLRCSVHANPDTEIPQAWQRLVSWREQSAYRRGTHQWLEAHLAVDEPGEHFTLDLYLPIAAS
jgi:DNA gyrase inhibitor GyrI